MITAINVAFLSLRTGLKWVMISKTRTLHNTTKILFVKRSIAGEHASENDDAACRKNMPGNKVAT